MSFKEDGKKSAHTQDEVSPQDLKIPLSQEKNATSLNDGVPQGSSIEIPGYQNGTNFFNCQFIQITNGDNTGKNTAGQKHVESKSETNAEQTATPTLGMGDKN